MMADERQLAILTQGVNIWNEWRQANPSIHPDLSQEGFEGWELSGVDFRFTNLINSRFDRADLSKADCAEVYAKRAVFRDANLAGVNFLNAKLYGIHAERAVFDHAVFMGADLTKANLSDASLSEAKFWLTNLSSSLLENSDFTDAVMGVTTIANSDLSSTRGLESVTFSAPISIAIDVIFKCMRWRLSSLSVSTIDTSWIPQAVLFTSRTDRKTPRTILIRHVLVVVRLGQLSLSPTFIWMLLFWPGHPGIFGKLVGRTRGLPHPGLMHSWIRVSQRKIITGRIQKVLDAILIHDSYTRISYLTTPGGDMNKLRYSSLRYCLLISICIFAISSCGRSTRSPTEAAPPTSISPPREIATNTEEPSPPPVEPSATAVEIHGLEEISLFSAGGYQAAFSNDGKYIAYTPAIGIIRIVDSVTGELVHEIEIDSNESGGLNGTRVVKFSPDAQFLLAGGWEDRIDIWRVSNGALNSAYKMAYVFGYSILHAAAPASDVEFVNETNFLIASPSDHGGLGQINISTGEYIQIFEKPVYDIALSSTEPVAVLATQPVAIDFWESEYPVVLFDYEKGSVVGEYFGTDPFDNPYEHLPAADSVALSPDGRYIAAIVEFSTLRVWDRIQEEEISVDVPAVIGYMRQVGFSPQGHLVTISATSASCRSYAWGLKDPEGKCTLAFWEVPSFELIAFEEMGLIVSFDFSADGSTIVTAGDELRFWEIP